SRLCHLRSRLLPIQRGGVRNSDGCVRQYLRATSTVFYRHHVRTETITNIVIFNRNSLALRHDGFEFSKVENDVGTVEPTNGATDNLTRAVLKLFVDHLLLRLADPLHHGLLCGLRRDASEIFWRNFDL